METCGTILKLRDIAQKETNKAHQQDRTLLRLSQPKGMMHRSFVESDKVNEHGPENFISNVDDSSQDTEFIDATQRIDEETNSTDHEETPDTLVRIQQDMEFLHHSQVNLVEQEQEQDETDRRQEAKRIIDETLQLEDQ